LITPFGYSGIAGAVPWAKVVIAVAMSNKVVQRVFIIKGLYKYKLFMVERLTAAEIFKNLV
jgi:hypothetical protein